MAFMMNKLAMNDSCEIIVEKLNQFFGEKLFLNSGAGSLYSYMHYTG